MRKSGFHSLLNVLFVLVFVLAATGAPVQAASQRPDPLPPVDPQAAPEVEALGPHSTTGPVPPAGAALASTFLPSTAAVTIDVPAYNWHDGCGPTAAGMVLGYWDIHNFSYLYPNTYASTQNSQVDEGISTSVNARSHYNDYAMPIGEDTRYPIKDDACRLGAGCTPHANDSIADFMHTSRSEDYLRYGWSYFTYVDDSYVGYVNYINAHYGTSYHAATNNYYYSDSPSTMWAALKAEVNAGRPITILVDSDGNGQTDHFVTVTGYDVDSLGNWWYRSNDTWGLTPRWERFRGMSADYDWGVFGMTTLSLTGSDTPFVATDWLHIPMARTAPPPLTLKSFTLRDDPNGGLYSFTQGNNDRKANPGEFIILKPSIYNPNNFTLYDLEIELISDDPYFNGITAYENDYDTYEFISSLAPKATDSSQEFYISIASSTPPGHVLSTTLFITDGNGREWKLPLAFTVNGSDRSGPLPVMMFPQSGYYPAGEPVTLTCFVLETADLTSVTAYPHYPGSTTPVASLPLYDDGTHGDSVAGDRYFTTTWTPSVASDYQVNCGGVDVLNNAGPVKTNLSAFTNKAFTPTQNVLLVLDRTFDTGPGYMQSYFTSAMSAHGYTYDVWDSYYRGAVDLAALNGYASAGKGVIYSLTTYGYLGFNETVSDSLISYLNGGGDLFITGQDVGYWTRYNTNNFLEGYLHAEFVQDDTDLYGLNGQSSFHIYTDDLSLTINGTGGANNQVWPSEINPIAPAEQLFTYHYASGAASPAEQPQTAEGLPIIKGPEDRVAAAGGANVTPSSGIWDSGTGGLFVNTGTYRVVFLSFGFEAINNATTRATLMDRILFWLLSIH